VPQVTRIFSFFFLSLLISYANASAQSIATKRDQFCASYTCPAPKAGQTVVCKQNLGDVYYASISNLLFVCNQVSGYLFLDIYGGQNNQILYNNLQTSHAPTASDTCSTVIFKNQTNSNIEGNVFTSTFKGACKGNPTGQEALVKFYEFRSSSFKSNEINNNGDGQLVYGGIELRSSSMDSTFSKNVINTRKSGNRAIFSHFSNVCCNTAGDLWSPCNPPGDNPSGYNENCDNRRNTFDSNQIYGDANSIFFDDGSFQNTFKNNLLVGTVHLADDKGTSVLYNNTIDGEGGHALEVSSLAVSLRNNILRTNGTTPISGTISGDYNLFWPAFGSGQAHSLNINPALTSITATNPATRDYRLSSNSPAINVADPNTGVSPMSISTDINGAPRPVGGKYDLGAYEFQTSSGDTLAPAAPSGLRTLP